MRIPRLLPILALAGIAINGCDESSVGPGVGSGNQMEAKINGTEVTFKVEPVINSYDPVTKVATFGGTTAGTPARALTFSFAYDIEAGPFPKTFKDPAISITYVETSPGDTTTAFCATLQQNCTFTLTASDGKIIDGTFSAVLTDDRDTTSKISVSGGTFSAKLR